MTLPTVKQIDAMAALADEGTNFKRAAQLSVRDMRRAIAAGEGLGGEKVANVDAATGAAQGFRNY